jgi:hypothetical protein
VNPEDALVQQLRETAAGHAISDWCYAESLEMDDHTCKELGRLALAAADGTDPIPNSLAKRLVEAQRRNAQLGIAAARVPRLVRVVERFLAVVPDPHRCKGRRHCNICIARAAIQGDEQ